MKCIFTSIFIGLFASVTLISFGSLFATMSAKPPAPTRASTVISQSPTSMPHFNIKLFCSSKMASSLLAVMGISAWPFAFPFIGLK